MRKIIGFLPGAIFLLMCGMAAESTPGDVTYGNTIEPMVQSKCLPCHGKTHAAPFDFSTYEGVTSRIELIRTQLLSKSMPPVWTHSDFGSWAAIEPLTDREALDFQIWTQKGMPKGKVKPFRETPSAREKADSTLTLPGKAKVRAEGVPYWQVHSIALPKNGGGFDRFELIPNNPRALRSATLAIVPATMSLPKETAGSMDIDGMYLVGVWAPGYRTWSLPKGLVRPYPANSKLIVQAHYRPTGKQEDAGFSIRLFRSKATKPSAPRWISLEKKPLYIDAGEALAIDLTYVVPRDLDLISILPEARFYAGKIELLSVAPGQKPKVVFEDQRWDPYWIGNFSPAKPIKLTKGSTLIARFHYNNDENCRINQNRPLLPVKGGPTAGDEVCRMHLLVGP